MTSVHARLQPCAKKCYNSIVTQPNQDRLVENAIAFEFDHSNVLRFGRSKEKCNILLCHDESPTSGLGIGAIHFSLKFDLKNRNLILTDSSTYGTVVESSFQCKTQVKKATHVISNGDIIVVGKIELKLILFPFEDREWEKYRSAALNALPDLDVLAVRAQPTTVIASAVSLTILDEGEDSRGVAKATDHCGIIYAVKRNPKKPRAVPVFEHNNVIFAQFDPVTTSLVMPWVDPGSLADHPSVPEHKMSIVAYHTLDALAYLHEKQFSHGAIQPSSILISSWDSVHVKVGGFCNTGGSRYRPSSSAQDGSYDVFSTGMMILVYGLYAPWNPCKLTQISRPGWEGLTQAANFMLKGSPPAKECLKNVPKRLTNSSAVQYHTNLNFLQKQKIKNSSSVYIENSKPTLYIQGESSCFSKSLTDVITSLNKQGTEGWTRAAEFSNLVKLIESVHLGEINKSVCWPEIDWKAHVQ